MNVAKLKKTYGIGITGGIATGKSTISQFIRAAGYHCFDADILARKVVEPFSEGLRSIVEAFGDDVLDEQGRLNRRAMRGIIMQDQAKRHALEAIVHPLIHKELEHRLIRFGLDRSGTYWFYEAALLVETNQVNDFRELWVAYCPPEIQINRLCLRDGVTRDEAEKILKTQRSAEEKAAVATQIFNTDKSLPALRDEIHQALQKLPDSKEL